MKTEASAVPDRATARASPRLELNVLETPAVQTVGLISNSLADRAAHSSHQEVIVGPANESMAIRMQTKTEPIRASRCGPPLSTIKPINGPASNPLSAPNSLPPAIDARLQPNSFSSGSKNRPIEYVGTLSRPMPNAAASTTVQFRFHSAREAEILGATKLVEACIVSSSRTGHRRGRLCASQRFMNGAHCQKHAPSIARH